MLVHFCKDDSTKESQNRNVFLVCVEIRVKVSGGRNPRTIKKIELSSSDHGSLKSNSPSD